MGGDRGMMEGARGQGSDGECGQRREAMREGRCE